MKRAFGPAKLNDWAWLIRAQVIQIPPGWSERVLHIFFAKVKENG